MWSGEPRLVGSVSVVCERAVRFGLWRQAVGARVLAERKRRRWSQVRLAEACGWVRDDVVRVEGGWVTVDELLLVAGVFGVDVKVLLADPTEHGFGWGEVNERLLD